MTANERRKQILEKLCARRYDTRENLAVEFGVSERTIERDVLTLSLSYPIYTVQGNGGGIYVEDWYKLDGKYLSDEQSELLEELLPTLAESKAAIMRSILDTFKSKRRRTK